MKVLYKTKIQQDIYNLILILFILLNNDLYFIDIYFNRENCLLTNVVRITKNAVCI